MERPNDEGPVCGECGSRHVCTDPDCVALNDTDPLHWRGVEGCTADVSEGCPVRNCEREK